jgi:hypothetical protein
VFRPVKLFAESASVRSRNGLKRGVRNEPEHPDLLDDVIPFARGLQLVGENIVQLLAHGDDPMCHRLDVLLPVFKELGVV